MGSLMRTRPETLDDLTSRSRSSGPVRSSAAPVNPYIERRQRRRIDPNFKIPYEHPSLAGPLEETLGTIIFQDQVLEVAQAFAGYTAGQAESLRRAMSRKRSEAALQAHEEQFVRGAMRTHDDVSEALAREIFRKVLGFSGFGFPKAIRRPSPCWPTSRPGCACTMARSSCARCPMSSRWGSTRPTPRPRGAASRHHRPGARDQRQCRALHDRVTCSWWCGGARGPDRARVRARRARRGGGGARR